MELELHHCVRCLQTTLSHINEAEVAEGQSKHHDRPCVSVSCSALSPCTTEISHKAGTAGCCGCAGPPEKRACKPDSASDFFVL